MKIIRGETFTDYSMEVEEDNTLLTQCIFTGTPPKEGAIMARGYANLMIEYCKFPDLTKSAIVLRSTSGSINTTIRYSEFDNVYGNGVIAKAGNFGVNIYSNIFNNVGQTELFHPLYIMSPDALAEDNTINGTAGNGISIRTSGILRRNHIKKPGKSSICYFSDGVPGASNLLVAEDNDCNGSGKGRAAIALLYGGGEMVERYVIRRNKVTTYGEEAYGFAPEFQGQVIELEL